MEFLLILMFIGFCIDVGLFYLFFTFVRKYNESRIKKECKDYPELMDFYRDQNRNNRI